LLEVEEVEQELLVLIHVDQYLDQEEQDHQIQFQVVQ
jgi:hypothetical protein